MQLQLFNLEKTIKNDQWNYDRWWKDSVGNQTFYQNLENYQIMRKKITSYQVRCSNREWGGKVIVSRRDLEYTSEIVEDGCPWVFKFACLFVFNLGIGNCSGQLDRWLSTVDVTEGHPLCLHQRWWRVHAERTRGASAEAVGRTVPPGERSSRLRTSSGRWNTGPLLEMSSSVAHVWMGLITHRRHRGRNLLLQIYFRRTGAMGPRKQCADDVFLRCTVETDVVLWTDVTPIK